MHAYPHAPEFLYTSRHDMFHKQNLDRTNRSLIGSRRSKLADEFVASGQGDGLGAKFEHLAGAETDVMDYMFA